MLKMILFERFRRDGSKASKGAKVAIFACDFCKSEFEIRGYLRIRQKLRSKHQFCNTSCSGRYRWADPNQNPVMAENLARGRSVVRTRYGNPMLAPGANEKLRVSLAISLEEQRKNNDGLTNSNKTALERYGTPCTFQLPHLKAKANDEKAKVKRAATSSRKRLINSSFIEEQYYQALIERYGPDQVMRQVVDPVRRKWVIDFYVIPLNVYVQVDGVYWHGLDRSLSEIQSSLKVRDKSILRKWHTDREQDESFKRRGMRLLRVTDLQFKKGTVLP